MRTIAKISLLLALTVLFSCEEILTPDCGDCSRNKPDRARLEIRVGGVGSELMTLLTIYEGHIEDNVILFSEYIGNDIEFEFGVPINKTFTATALYIIDNVRYTTIGEATPRPKLDEESCDDPCYFIKDNTINLRLKYY